MNTIAFNSYDELSNFFRTKRDNFPILAYIVFKKQYKARSYEMNFEILLNNQETIISLMRTKIDESDYKKMKYILSKVECKEINEANRKAITYQYEFTAERELKALYTTCEKGLQDIQFSDFYA